MQLIYKDWTSLSPEKQLEKFLDLPFLADPPLCTPTFFQILSKEFVALKTHFPKRHYDLCVCLSRFIFLEFDPGIIDDLEKMIHDKELLVDPLLSRLDLLCFYGEEFPLLFRLLQAAQKQNESLVRDYFSARERRVQLLALAFERLKNIDPDDRKLINSENFWEIANQSLLTEKHEDITALISRAGMDDPFYELSPEIVQQFSRIFPETIRSLWTGEFITNIVLLASCALIVGAELLFPIHLLSTIAMLFTGADILALSLFFLIAFASAASLFIEIVTFEPVKPLTFWEHRPSCYEEEKRVNAINLLKMEFNELHQLVAPTGTSTSTAKPDDAQKGLNCS